MQVPIPTLRGTATHATAVELYQGHRGDASGVRTVPRAGAMPGTGVRRVGHRDGRESLRWYDGRLMPPAPPSPVAASAGAPGRPERHAG
jgi:hypothetical protein